MVVMAACGGDGGLDIDHVDDAVLSAACNLYVSCGLISDQTACREVAGTTFDVDASVIAAVHAGKVKFHGDKAQACIDKMYGSGSCDRAELLDASSSRVDCIGAFEGTVAGAGACQIDEECISQKCSILTCAENTCCTGACAGGTVPASKALGETCSVNDDCAEGYCDEGGSGTCAAQIADGQACSSSVSCASGSCNITCQALVAHGGPCTTPSGCADFGDTCNGISLTCTAYGKAGAACFNHADCSQELTCDTTQHCAARPKLGDACSNNVQCIGASWCDTSVMKCVAPKANGASCESSDECTSGYCPSAGTCTTRAVCS